MSSGESEAAGAREDPLSSAGSASRSDNSHAGQLPALGSAVTIQNLSRAHQYNGMLGKVTELLPDGRIGVALDSGKRLMVKKENLIFGGPQAGAARAAALLPERLYDQTRRDLQPSELEQSILNAFPLYSSSAGTALGPAFDLGLARHVVAAAAARSVTLPSAETAAQSRPARTRAAVSRLTRMVRRQRHPCAQPPACPPARLAETAHPPAPPRCPAQVEQELVAAREEAESAWNDALEAGGAEAVPDAPGADHVLAALDSSTQNLRLILWALDCLKCAAPHARPAPDPPAASTMAPPASSALTASSWPSSSSVASCSGVSP